MPLRPIAVAFALVFLALALLMAYLAVPRLRRRRWGYLALVALSIVFLVVASLPIPYIFGIGAPHPVFNAPAPVPSGIVAYYVVNQAPLSAQQGQLVATQASTGKLLWQRALPSPQPLVSSDATSVYAAARQADSSDILALDGATGAVLWQRTLTGATVSTAPLLQGGMLVLSVYANGAANPQQILALRPTDGQQLWSVRVGPDDTFAANTLQLLTSPDPTVVYDMPNASALEARAVTDGRLLWATTGVSGQVVAGADAIYELAQYGSVTAYSVGALAAQNRTPLWQFGDHQFFHAGAIVGDTLYVTAQHGDTPSDNAASLAHPETVYALDAHTGSLRWKFATHSADLGSLAAGPAGVFIRADDGIHALRTNDGTVLWHDSSRTNWLFARTPLFVGPVIDFFAQEILPPERLTILQGHDEQAYLYAVNTSTGDLYWGQPVGPVITIPAFHLTY
ncbi:MAG TPA: PQQ-binding-like beta-propeller repeat protein [Ktedonobacterales bacterium]